MDIKQVKQASVDYKERGKVVPVILLNFWKLLFYLHAKAVIRSFAPKSLAEPITIPFIRNLCLRHWLVIVSRVLFCFEGCFFVF